MRLWAAGTFILSTMLATVGVEVGETDRSEPDAARSTRGLISDVSVDVSVDKADFRPLEPIALRVAARNVSLHDAWRPCSGHEPYASYRTFRVKVFDRDGHLLPETRFLSFDAKFLGREVGQSSGSCGMAFRPGEVIRGRLVANLAYDMTSIGEYTIVVEYPHGAGASRDDGSVVPMVVRSRPIRVRVVEESS